MSKKKTKKRLNKSDVLAIKQALTDGGSQAAIAAQYKVSRSLVSDIATGRTHRDVGGEVPARKRGGQYKKTTPHDPNDIRIQELEAEVVHLREERDYARRAAKAGSKQYGIFRAMVEEMESRIQPLPAVPKLWTPPRRKDVIQEHVVLHISDAHADEIVRAEEVAGLEEFNFPIACARAEKLIDTTLGWCTETLNPKFHFPVLWLLCNGDMSSGEIHGAGPRSYFRNQIKNCLAIGKLKALMIRDLAPHFPKINVVCVSGNHGRRTTEKDHHAALNNWDALISNVARLHCADLDNVEFLIPDAFSINLDINGVGFNLSHGDDVRSNAGVPFYALVRRQKNLMALGAMQGGLPIRYHAIGHHHTMSSLADFNGELLVNGSWLGTSAYAFNSFAGYREPQQLLHGVHKDHGITWKLGVKMKHDGEKDGPKRYKIEGAEEVQVIKK